jgi:hypothetical protein
VSRTRAPVAQSTWPSPFPLCRPKWACVYPRQPISPVGPVSPTGYLSPNLNPSSPPPHPAPSFPLATAALRLLSLSSSLSVPPHAAHPPAGGEPEGRRVLLLHPRTSSPLTAQAGGQPYRPLQSSSSGSIRAPSPPTLRWRPPSLIALRAPPLSVF